MAWKSLNKPTLFFGYMKRKTQFIWKGAILFTLIINLIPGILNIWRDYTFFMGWLNLLGAALMLIFYLNFKRLVKWRKL